MVFNNSHLYTTQPFMILKRFIYSKSKCYEVKKHKIIKLCRVCDASLR